MSCMGIDWVYPIHHTQYYLHKKVENLIHLETCSSNIVLVSNYWQNGIRIIFGVSFALFNCEITLVLA